MPLNGFSFSVVVLFLLSCWFSRHRSRGLPPVSPPKEGQADSPPLDAVLPLFAVRSVLSFPVGRTMALARFGPSDPSSCSVSFRVARLQPTRPKRSTRDAHLLQARIDVLGTLCFGTKARASTEVAFRKSKEEDGASCGVPEDGACGLPSGRTDERSNGRSARPPRRNANARGKRSSSARETSNCSEREIWEAGSGSCSFFRPK